MVKDFCEYVRKIMKPRSRAACVECMLSQINLRFAKLFMFNMSEVELHSNKSVPYHPISY